MPVENPILYGGITALREDTDQYNFNYTQGWSTGTLMQVSYNNQRLGLPTSIPPEFFPFNPDADRLLEGAGAAASAAGLGPQQQPARDSDRAETTAR